MSTRRKEKKKMETGWLEIIRKTKDLTTKLTHKNKSKDKKNYK